MIRSALAVALVLLACLFSVSEELLFSLDPPRAGQAAPFSVRADRRFSVGSPEARGAAGRPGRARHRHVPDRGCAGALPAAHGRRRPPTHPGARGAAGPGAAVAIPVGLFVAVWSIVFLGSFLLALPREATGAPPPRPCCSHR
ncbi:MAG: hypothetical protein MZV70_21875 [Desulfobacterales bacterium]|nr:hypothetical protein [Desulfobacterales bacterium]